jgi:hypothetical protein
MIAVTLYSFVLSLHIAAVLAAYGLPFAYPMLVPYVRRNHPAAMPGLHDVQHRLNVRLATPASVLIVGFGVYMATEGRYWDEVWLLVALGLFAAISVIGATYIVPVSRRMAELARADVEATPTNAGVSWGVEYDRVFNHYVAVEAFLGLLVLVAVFFMTAKPFA